MPQELLSASLQEAEHSEPAVRAAALLHIARVMSAFDHAQAEGVVERALALASDLPEPDREVLLAQAVSLVATVSPKRALELAPSVSADDMPGSVMQKALFDMMSHGHVAEAIDYLSAPNVNGEYPFDAALQAMGRSNDDAVRLRILRGALAAMRLQMRAVGIARFLRGMSTQIFNRWYGLLPPDEAAAVVRDLVHWILGQPDESINASAQDVRFSSTHAHRLFQIIGPLQRLDPQLAQSVIKEHLQLAAAAARYPYGQESIEAALHQRDAQAPATATTEQPHYILVGHRLIPIPEALRTNFKEAFDVALRAYFTDTDPEHPNDAPRECWPSASEFRNILYKAGQHEGPGAVRHLDRIPDAALRLFAQIELAAALAGLPQIGGMSITPGPYGFRQSRAMARKTDGGAPHIPPPVMHREPPVRKPDVPPSFEARIMPARRGVGAGPAGGSGPDYWVIEGAPLRPILATLYDISDRRIDLTTTLDANRFDFALVLPQSVSRETMIRLMRESIEKAFHVTRELRPMDVDVLTAPNGVRAHAAGEDMFGMGGIGAFGSMGFVEDARNGPGHVQDGFQLMEIMNLHMVPSEVEATTPEEGLRAMKSALLRASSVSTRGGVGINSVDDSLTMEELCQLLESGLDRPVIDDTRLTGRYVLKVHSEVVNTRDFLRLLCEKVGLVVTSERRDVPVLIVQER
jgi:uncharacterized protein (TIGR03435 family)